MDFDYKIEGNLPARVLRPEISKWFASISDSLKQDVTHAEVYESLNPIIGYNAPEDKISDVAYIDKNNQIQLFENYNQYLWCISYFLLVIYDNCLQKPMIEGNYKGEFNFEQQENKIAKGVFISGINLTDHYIRNYFYKQPNCEMPVPEFEEVIGLTNGIFVSSLSYIVAHEFSHYYYQHDPDEYNSKVLIKNEFEADDLAIFHIRETFERQEGYNYKVGIIAAFCSFYLCIKIKVESSEIVRIQTGMIE